MGFGGGGAPAAPAAVDEDKIRAEEAAKMRSESMDAIRKQESKRAKLRASLGDEETTEQKKKVLFGE